MYICGVFCQTKPVNAFFTVVYIKLICFFFRFQKRSSSLNPFVLHSLIHGCNRFSTLTLNSIIKLCSLYSPSVRCGGGGRRTPSLPVDFCLLLKKSSGYPYLKILYFYCGCPYEKKKLPPARRHPVQKYFKFWFNKKILLQTLVEIIFRHHYIFLEFWDPLPYKQNEEK